VYDPPKKNERKEMAFASNIRKPLVFLDHLVEYALNKAVYSPM
jgi:hypothetical protein